MKVQFSLVIPPHPSMNTQQTPNPDAQVPEGAPPAKGRKIVLYSSLFVTFQKLIANFVISK